MGNLKVYGTTEEWTNVSGTNVNYFIQGTTVSNAKATSSSYSNSRCFSVTAGDKYFFSYTTATNVSFVTSTSTNIQLYGFIFFASSSNSVNATITPITDVTAATIGGVSGYIFTIPEGCSYFWIGGMSNSSSWTINQKISTNKLQHATEVSAWIDADCYKIPSAPQLVNTNNTKSINKNSYYSGGTWHTSYGLSSSYATSDTLKYLPSSTSQQVVKILVPNTVTSPGFFYGTVAGTTLTPEGDCSYTTETIDNKILYTVTIPANKACFVTKYLTGSSSTTSQNYYYEGFVPDDISVDNDWITGAFHKFNGTSWD